jgi:hypothetical protein
MALFDCFNDEYHQVRFDNLYMAAKFALRSFQHDKKVLIEGVTRVGGRGIPHEILQNEVTTKAAINATKGTVKAAVLQDCPPLVGCPLVCASVYDTKPVHFLSTCCTKVEWITKTRKTWDHESGGYRIGQFLRLCINDSYNRKMGDVDIADQLRGNYRPDAKWMRKMKWWHAMYNWGRGTDIINAYCAYKRFMEDNGKTPLTHYNFRKAAILAKINPGEYGTPKQQQSVAFQRGDHRGMPRGGGSKRSVANSVDTANDFIHGRYMTSASLASTGSIFNEMRLNPTLCHLPVPVEERCHSSKCCTLCRWATGKKYKAQVSWCEACSVALCVWCFKSFHTVVDLQLKKDMFCLEIVARKQMPGKM